MFRAIRMNDDRTPLTFWLGLLSLAASLAVLVFQQTLGEMLGIGVMLLWLGLGGLGIYLMGLGRR